MNPLIHNFAYYAVLTLGVAGLLALLLLTGVGVVYLYAWFLARYLAAKKLHELFREFMYERLREENAAKRKE